MPYSFPPRSNGEVIQDTWFNALQDAVAALSRQIDVQAVLVVGAAYVADNILPPGVVFPDATTITTLHVRCGSAPTGSALTVRFKLNGTAIGTVTVPAGSVSASTTVSVPVAAGDVTTWDITAVGSTAPGSAVAIRMIGA